MWDNLQTAGGGVRKFFVHLNMTVGRGQERDGDRGWGEGGEGVWKGGGSGPWGLLWWGVEGFWGGGRWEGKLCGVEKEGGEWERKWECLGTASVENHAYASTSIDIPHAERGGAIHAFTVPPPEPASAHGTTAHPRAANGRDNDDPGHTCAASRGGDNAWVHTSAGERAGGGCRGGGEQTMGTGKMIQNLSMQAQVQVQLEGDGAAEGATGVVDRRLRIRPQVGDTRHLPRSSGQPAPAPESASPTSPSPAAVESPASQALKSIIQQDAA
ncbi:hypothetical protein JB92DRAFT_2831386 [Gautieria morchelliformis]|nr:hypothetical protein JB92DRAFT_2831386 [Gautieria morchelliformis]